MLDFWGIYGHGYDNLHEIYRRFRNQGTSETTRWEIKSKYSTKQNKKSGGTGSNCERKEVANMKDRVVEIIRNACAIDEEVTLDSELKLLSLDSLTFVSIVVELEEEFGIEFELDELGVFDWKTVEDIANSVEEKVNEK